MAQAKTAELSDEGRQPEAVTALKQSAEKLKQVGRRYEDSELLKEAEAVEAQADPGEVLSRENLVTKCQYIFKIKMNSYSAKRHQR